MVDVDPFLLTAIGVGIGVAGLLSGVLASSFRHGKEHGKLETSIKHLETTVESFRPAVAYTNAILEISKNPEILKIVRDFGQKEPEKRNPYDPAVKNELITRYQNSTLNLEQAKELQRILQEDFQLAETTDAVAAVAIIIVLVAIVVLISILAAGGSGSGSR